MYYERSMTLYAILTVLLLSIVALSVLFIAIFILAGIVVLIEQSKRKFGSFR